MTSIKFSFSATGNNIYTSRITARATITGAGEYRLYLYNQFGALMEKEPDFYWENINGTETISAEENLGDLYPFFRARVFNQEGKLEGTAVMDITNGRIIQGNPETAPDAAPDFAEPFDFGYNSNNQLTNSSGNPIQEPTTIGDFVAEKFQEGLNILIFVGVIVLFAFLWKNFGGKK